ncbi:MAG: tetratricopeptide repeat protein [Bacteriodetes bacterium]|nr:tetratricopeptide repeat protein [Bacteroidota bacterium]
MTPEELSASVEELETLLKTEYNQVEAKASELLAIPLIKQHPDLHCRVLHILSSSLRNRRMTKAALPIAEEALALAEDNSELKARIYNNIGNIYFQLEDYTQSLDYYDKALLLFQAHGNQIYTARVLHNIGNSYVALSDYTKALQYFYQGQTLFEDVGNRYEISRSISDIGLVYLNLGDYTRSLHNFLEALSHYEQLENKYEIANTLGSLGTVHTRLSDYSSALDYCLRSLAIYKELQNKEGIARSFGNIGSIYGSLGEYTLAMENFLASLVLYQEVGREIGIAVITGNIGSMYANKQYEGFDEVKAEEYLLKAIAIDEQISAKANLLSNLKPLSELYKQQERWKDYAYCLEKYYVTKNEVQSDEAKKVVYQMEQQKQVAERDRQLALAQKEKAILNNILPKEITTRLIQGEQPIADTFDAVSILFMDIVDFTVLSSKISAQQLVHLLNNIFTAADGVMREFGLEKIKTIGDAYMAVAGAPIVQEDHTHRAANAALTLLDVMQNLVVTFPEKYGDRSWIESIPEIQVRIGLHCGPAVAGVVGENKFLYDLWGDAVNTASRMESHGEAGKIHVSEEFAQHLTQTLSKGEGLQNETPSLSGKVGMGFVPRGEIEIKGKGTMNTYFLERA